MKKTFTKVMLVRLTLILHVATATMAVYSIDWNGTSATTGGSGDVPATGGYTVHSSESLQKICVGYRFSISKVSN